MALGRFSKLKGQNFGIEKDSKTWAVKRFSRSRITNFPKFDKMEEYLTISKTAYIMRFLNVSVLKKNRKILIIQDSKYVICKANLFKISMRYEAVCYLERFTPIYSKIQFFLLITEFFCCYINWKWKFIGLDLFLQNQL